MGFVCILSGVANAFLPETKNENLPQTIADGDQFGRNMVFFSLAKKQETTLKAKFERNQENTVSNVVISGSNAVEEAKDDATRV